MLISFILKFLYYDIKSNPPSFAIPPPLLYKESLGHWVNLKIHIWLGQTHLHHLGEKRDSPRKIREDLGAVSVLPVCEVKVPCL